MCFYKYREVNDTANFIEIGHIKIAILEDIAGPGEALIVCCNAELSIGQDPFEVTYNLRARKQTYLKETGVLKPGHIAKFPVEDPRAMRVVIYIVLPSENVALKHFFLHKGLVKGLEMALKDQHCARVNVPYPKLLAFGLSEEFYVEKIISALRVLGLKNIPGIITIQLKAKYKQQISEELSKKIYEEGECDEW